MSVCTGLFGGIGEGGITAAAQRELVSWSATGFAGLFGGVGEGGIAASAQRELVGVGEGGSAGSAHRLCCSLLLAVVAA